MMLIQRFITCAAISAFVLGLVSCAAPTVPPSPPPDRGVLTHTVFVASNGFHTSIVFARADVSAVRVPEVADFPGATFLEFGWGDREYFPSRDPSIGMALSAALTPTPAVMHLVGLDKPPQVAYRKAEVLSLRLSTVSSNRLIKDIDASFDRPSGDRAKSVAPGLYHNSRFYSARGEFHLSNTCNTWVALKLHAAGLDIDPAGIMTAGDLMDALRSQPNVTVLRH